MAEIVDGEKQTKPKVDVVVECAYCRKALRVKVFREIVTPAEPAEVELHAICEKEPVGLFPDTETTPGAQADPMPAPPKAKRGRPKKTE